MLTKVHNFYKCKPSIQRNSHNSAQINSRPCYLCCAVHCRHRRLQPAPQGMIFFSRSIWNWLNSISLESTTIP